MSISGHVRTIWPVVRRFAVTPPAPASEPWSVEVSDPTRGRIRLTGSLSRIVGGRIVGGRVARDRDASGRDAGCNALLILVHGLGGSSNSTYMLRTAAVASQLGVSTLRLNLRGADCQGSDLYHAGLSRDLASVLASPALAEFDSVLLFGFSLGGHIGLRYATEAHDPRLRAVAAACSPLDLDRSVAAIDQSSKWIYRRYVLAGLCEMYAQVAARHPLPLSVADARKVRTIRDWDRLTVVPRFGFDSAEDYYRRASVGGRLGQLRIPALLVAAEDDPMLPAEAILRGLDGAPDHWLLRWVPRGGHLAFSDDLDLGLGSAPKGLGGQVLGWLLRQVPA